MAERPLVEVRADFPVLEREFNGRRVAYLDSAATSQRPHQVVEAMDRFQRHSYAPIHRGVYELARES
ncbi:MAG TPA: aminotransferase class V-fold PLP-dependent enzyme, partial [Thermoleophilaceae bacterium]|nr:aminotransferase class V-fold PLP-dependent enzyme [Thermoleophilaceae bacterium]